MSSQQKEVILIIRFVGGFPHPLLLVGKTRV